MNRPYKSTSLDDLFIICRNVPNRDVLRAILTELSHRDTKPAKNLETILVQHLINQSGDSTVGSLKTASGENQSNSTDIVEPIDTGGKIKGAGHNKRRLKISPKQSKHPITKKHQTASTEFKSGDSQILAASAMAGKTSTPAEMANVRNGQGLKQDLNRAIADKAPVEKRSAGEPIQKSEKPRKRTIQSKDSQTKKTGNKPSAEWVSWKRLLLKTMVYICGLIFVVALVGYAHFLYNERVQTATNFDENQKSSAVDNNIQKGLDAPDRGDLAQDIQENLEAPDRVDLAQDIQKSLEAPDRVELEQDIQKSLDAPDSVDLAQDIQKGLEASEKDDLAQDFQKGLDAYKKGDYPTALREFRVLSEQENADAQYYLGLLFDKGQGVVEDFEEAVKWYRRSAEQGNADAQLILGINYYEGEDVPEDYEEAASWYRKSAEQGSADAQNRLGFMYEKGYGVVHDYGVAAKWYRKSAEQGNVNAQKNLSARYFLGQGVIQDNVYAHMWANISASKGNKTAINIRDLVAKKMAASDISKAEELARECVRKNHKGC